MLQRIEEKYGTLQDIPASASADTAADRTALQAAALYPRTFGAHPTPELRQALVELPDARLADALRKFYAKNGNAAPAAEATEIVAQYRSPTSIGGVAAAARGQVRRAARAATLLALLVPFLFRRPVP